MNNNCEWVRQNLPDYWAGTIAVKDHREIDAHLEGCTACQSEASELGRLWTRLDLIPVDNPGSQVRTRFYEMLDAYRSGVEEGAASPKPVGSFLGFLRIPTWQFAGLASAAAFALLAVGFFAGRAQQQQQAKPAENVQIAQLRGEVQSMRQMVALSLLQQESAADRIRGVKYAYKVDKTDNEVVTALLDTVKTDPSVNVRLAAVDAFKNFSSNTAARRKLLESIRVQDSPLVQIAIIELLVDLNDQTSVKTLDTFAKDAALPREVQDRARWAVTELH